MKSGGNDAARLFRGTDGSVASTKAVAALDDKAHASRPSSAR
jgi:hypothetical protein